LPAGPFKWRFLVRFCSRDLVFWIIQSVEHFSSMAAYKKVKTVCGGGTTSRPGLGSGFVIVICLSRELCYTSPSGGTAPTVHFHYGRTEGGRVFLKHIAIGLTVVGLIGG
jgi:hypothetical protein